MLRRFKINIILSMFYQHGSSVLHYQTHSLSVSSAKKLSSLRAQHGSHCEMLSGLQVATQFDVAKSVSIKE